MNAALAAAATLVAAAFTLSTWDRWLRRRRSHELAWTVSLAMFTLGSAALWWAESTGWNLANFRLFYLAGAVLNVPWLALGTVYLLAGERRAGPSTCGWARGPQRARRRRGPDRRCAPRRGTVGTEMPTGKDVFGVAPRILAAVGSGVATLVIIVGALWSTVATGPDAVPAVAGHTQAGGTDRAACAGHLLIAVGTLILSASGTLTGRLGEMQAFAITLTAGIVVLFAGFLVAGPGRPRPTPSP